MTNFHYTYMLCDSNDTVVYFGYTSNPTARMKHHNAWHKGLYEFCLLECYSSKQEAMAAEKHFITSRNLPKFNISPGAGNSTNRSDWTKFKTSVTKQGQTYQTGPVIDLTTGNYYRNKSEACAVLGLNTGNLARHLAGELKSCGGREFSYFN